MDDDSKSVMGPICEECGVPRNYLLEVLVKKERKGRFEMVRAFLCFYHFWKKLENDMEEPPKKEELIPEEDWDAFKEWEEEHPDDDDEGWSSSTTDRIGQSFG